MTEGSMSDVMEQSCGPDQSPISTVWLVVEQVRIAAGQSVVDPSGELHRAEHVTESGVLRAREHQRGEAQLSNRPEALDGPAVDQCSFEGVGMNEPVNRVAK